MIGWWVARLHAASADRKTEPGFRHELRLLKVEQMIGSRYAVQHGDGDRRSHARRRADVIIFGQTTAKTLSFPR